MNITQEGYEMEKIVDKDKKTRGNVAPHGEELRDTIAYGRRLKSLVLPRVQGKQT
jgi:hypothetical protein